jgi:Fe-S-cluster containining protein
MGDLIDRAAAQLADLYARVPDVGCKGLCHDTCGPVSGGPAERLAMRRAGYPLPKIDNMGDGLRLLVNDPGYRCPALTADNRCAVYADDPPRRPMVCRVWGASESLPCPYGCAPGPGERLLTPAESTALMIAAENAGTVAAADPDVEAAQRIIDSHPGIAQRWQRMYTPRQDP